MRKLIYRLLMLLPVALLASCGSSRPAATVDSAVCGALSGAGALQLFEQLADDYRPYTDVYVPVNISVTSPVEMSISGRATIIRDKEIYISLRMLGMEVGVVYINDETVYVVDKFHKMYFSEQMSTLRRYVPLTVGNLQDMLLGRAFVTGGTTLSRADAPLFTFTTDKRQWTMTPLTTTADADWHYTATRTQTPVLTSLTVNLKSGTEIDCAYTGIAGSPAGYVASALTITAPLGDKPLRCELRWGLDDAKWESGRTVAFTAPGTSYKRINLNSILKEF